MAKTKRTKKTKVFFLIRLAGFLGSVGAIAAILVVALAAAILSPGLPDFESAEDYRPAVSTRVYSVDGRLIGEFGLERRVVIPYERIPKRLIQAFVATEDKKFFDHGGIDYLGIVRAVIFKAIGKSSQIGGTSTLTQQLAKGLLVAQVREQELAGAQEEIQDFEKETMADASMGIGKKKAAIFDFRRKREDQARKAAFQAVTARSYVRKVREALLARRLESTLNKEEIIWMYLNDVFLGHGAYGVQAAAEHYFRKDVEELELPEIALLAGLPQAPSRYSPLLNKEAAEQRVSTVLARMEKNNFITRAEKEEALSVDLVDIVQPRDNRFRDTAPYFAEHVRRYIGENYGTKALYEEGFRVYTTLDLERQNHAENALVNGLRTVDKRQGYRPHLPDNPHGVGPVANLPPEKRELAAQKIEEKLIKGAELQLGDPVMGIVMKVDRDNQWAEVRAGKTAGLLPLAGMHWARKVDPGEFWENVPVENVAKVVKEGDVILMTLESRESLKKMSRKGSTKFLPNDQDARPLFALDQVPTPEGALIAMNPHTGYVESMIGGYAYENSQFNRAFQSCRQPGSSFKPIVYSAAVVRENFTPATMILDTPITVRDTDIGKSWKPQNFEHAYKGEVTMREAIMNSMNVPALKTMESVGLKEALAWARKLGIRTELKEELGTAIGSSCVTPWELTGAYTTFARGGLRPEAVFIKRVIDRKGTVMEEHAAPNDPWQTHEQRLDSLYRMLEQPPARVMDAQDAFIVNYLLTQVARHGTAARASRLKKPVAGKTGTTNDSFDTWFVGYTPSLVTSVWVGYDTNAYPLARREQGGRTALPIWLEFMKNALEGKEEKEWQAPEGICDARVDSKTGYRVSEAVPGSFVAPFRCGTEPSSAAIAGGVSFEDALKGGGL